MDVILLGATPPPIGGIAKWTMRMLESELGDDWKIILVDEKILGGRGMFDDNRKINILYEIKRWTAIWSSVWKKTKSESVKIVHSTPIATTTSMLAELVNCKIAHKHGKKFIIHFRCTVPNMIGGKTQERLLQLFCNNADSIIALNTQTEKYLSNITKTDIHVIPNFVNASEMNNSRNIRDSIKTVVYVGGVIKEKGCDLIVQAADCFPEITFRLVGDYDIEMEGMASKHPNVVLTGSKNSEKVKEELRNADVFMFLSRYPGEGFSNSLAEAMASGLPCIVTDWAANRDMVGDWGGIVIESAQEESIINAIKTMQSKELRARFSLHNAKKVKEEYASEVILQQYVKLYNSLI